MNDEEKDIEQNEGDFHGVMDLRIPLLDISLRTGVDAEGHAGQQMLDKFGNIIITICAIIAMTIIKIHKNED